MLTVILVLSIIAGLFFRSLYGFVFSLIAFLIILYPGPTLGLLITSAIFTFFSKQQR